MPSPDGPVSGAASWVGDPRRWLLLSVVVVAAANLGAVFRRSAVPLSLSGRVVRIDVRREKHPGIDDVHLVTVDGREVHLDAEVAEALWEGDTLEKAAWAGTLETPRGALSLGPSKDMRRMLVAMPLLLLLGWVLLRRSRRLDR